MTEPKIRLYNTLAREKQDFRPIDPANVRMYVCGPTVYDFAHIGNARPAIVFDVLFRLLRHAFGPERVTYVRNITDVDDKINARALRDHPGMPLNEAIRKVTEPTAAQYRADVAALGCLPPTFEPRATEFVLPRTDGRADMTSLIQSLLDRGHAYPAEGEILFSTRSMADYGALSRRPLDEQQAGARVAVDAHKRDPADFVLWKSSRDDEPGWDARFTVEGRELPIGGRPGWHIECSAMSAAYLGEVFDIHGGGLDLIFPHHENEIAQSRCAHGTAVMANIWMHNGFLQVEGRKMSKSEGNFVTIHDLLETEALGGRRWPGEVLRLAMLMTHYREPIDFSVKRLEMAEALLNRWYRMLADVWPVAPTVPDDAVLGALADDLGTPAALDALYSLFTTDEAGAFELGASMLSYSLYEEGAASRALASAQLLGILLQDPSQWLQGGANLASDEIAARIERRLSLLREKNWPEADRIREELLAEGIQLKDGKDPATGERVTAWERKR